LGFRRTSVSGTIQALERYIIPFVEGTKTGWDHNQAIDRHKTTQHPRPLFLEGINPSIGVVPCPQKTAAFLRAWDRLHEGFLLQSSVRTLIPLESPKAWTNELFEGHSARCRIPRKAQHGGVTDSSGSDGLSRLHFHFVEFQSTLRFAL